MVEARTNSATNNTQASGYVRPTEQPGIGAESPHSLRTPGARGSASTQGTAPILRCHSIGRNGAQYHASHWRHTVQYKLQCFTDCTVYISKITSHWAGTNTCNVRNVRIVYEYNRRVDTVQKNHSAESHSAESHSTEKPQCRKTQCRKTQCRNGKCAHCSQFTRHRVA